MSEVGRDFLMSYDAIPLLKQGYLDQAAHGHVQMPFEYLQGAELHNLSGQPVTVLSRLYSEVLPDVQAEPPVFQFVPIASYPSTGHH